MFRTVATVNHPENSSLIATSGTFTATTSLGLPKGTTAQRPTPASTEGHIRYNTENKLVYYSNGTSWLKIASAETVLSSVSGNIVNGVATNVTLAGTGFLNDGLINIIGGCCGTTPEHIHAISKLASNYKPRAIDLT